MYIDMSDGTRKKITDNDKPGEKTAEGGEVFNDYENNKAIGEYSHAEGIESQSGAKAFTIVGVNKTNKTYTLDSVKGLSVGDIYSAHVLYTKGSSTQAENYGKITAINGNVVTVDNLWCECEFATSDSYISGGYDGEKNTFRIIDKPNVGTRVIGDISHAEGVSTKALSKGSHAEGKGTVAHGSWSHAEGNNTKAAFNAHAEGQNTKAYGHISHAEGDGSETSGYSSHAEGANTTASGGFSHAEGKNSKSTALMAHAEGNETTASGIASHAEGQSTVASKFTSHAEGHSTKALSKGSHAEGNETTASGGFSHAEGNNTKAYGESSHAEGMTTQSGSKAFTIVGVDKTNKTYTLDSVEGLEIGDVYSAHVLYTSGGSSQAENYGKITAINGNVVTVDNLWCEYNFATSDSYISDGYDSEKNTFRIIDKPNVGTRVIGDISHAEGVSTKALSKGSHAEGKETVAHGSWSHAEGFSTKSIGESSHAEGSSTKASGDYSHAEGEGTYAHSKHAHVQGKFNQYDKDNRYGHILGNGKNNDDRSNAHTVDWQGNAWFSGNIKIKGNSYDDSYAKELASTEDVENIKITQDKSDYNILTLSNVSTINHKMKVTVSSDNISDLSTIKLIKSNNLGETITEYTPNSDGTIDGVTSVGTRERVKNIWDGSIATGFSEGDGTVDSPYQIRNGAELAYLINTASYNTTNGKYYKLVNDIYLNLISSKYWYNNTISGSLKEWIYGTQSSSFCGTFDGDGHTIQGIYINDNTSIKGAGLFPNISNGTIKNLGIENSYISLSTDATVYSGVGALAAVIAWGTTRIDNCYSSDTVILTGYRVGGLICYAAGTSRITNCYSLAQLNWTLLRGGLVVQNAGNITLENCYSKNEALYIVGTVSDGGSDPKLSNCHTGINYDNLDFSVWYIDEYGIPKLRIFCYNLLEFTTDADDIRIHCEYLTKNYKYVLDNRIPKQTQADWQQNDETANNYIKNRPGGYIDNDTIVKIPEKYLDIKNTNIVNGGATGSLRTVGSESEIGQYAFAEGKGTTASGYASHAEGENTTASGYVSHAEGAGTTASGRFSHAEGTDTTALGNDQHVQGKYNIEDKANTYADIIGNGQYDKRSNAATVDWNGNAWYAGDVYVGSTSGTNKDEGSKKLATEEYIDKKIVDYIIEEGVWPNSTVKLWTYRKWNSGIAECWGKFAAITELSSQWAGYYTANLGSIDYPAGLFSEPPILNTILKAANFPGHIYIDG